MQSLAFNDLDALFLASRTNKGKKMKLRPLIAAGSLALAGVLAAPTAVVAATPSTIVAFDETPDVPETTAPVATYKLDRSSVFMAYDEEYDTEVGYFRLAETSSDKTATSRVIDLGGAFGTFEWKTGTQYLLGYTVPGTHRPVVRLTNAAGQTSTISLGAVTVKRDTSKPKVSLTVPKKPSKATSWKVIRGTASDTGTGLMATGVYVMQQRGKTWWAYDFSKKKWVKGFTSSKKTSDKAKANAAMVKVDKFGKWKSPTIKGLKKKGKLIVEVGAWDYAYNQTIKVSAPRTLK